jgi:hypothetical protein
MRKFKAFLKGDKASKDRDERPDVWGAPSASQSDRYGVTTLQHSYSFVTPLGNPNTTTNSVSSRLPAPASTSSTTRPETRRTPSPVPRAGSDRPGGRIANSSFSSSTTTSPSIAPSSAYLAVRQAANRPSSPINQRGYGLPGGRIASSSISSPTSTSQSTIPTSPSSTANTTILPIRRDLPGGRIASSPNPSRAATSQSTETRKVSTPGTYGTSPEGRIGRMSAPGKQPRVPSQPRRLAAGSTGAVSTSVGKTAKKSGSAEGSDSDDPDMDDLMSELDNRSDLAGY